MSDEPRPEQWRQLEDELTELGRTDPLVGEVQAQIEAEKQRLLKAARKIRQRRESMGEDNR